MTCMSLQRPPPSFLLPPHPVRTSPPLGNLRRLPLTLSWSFSAFREHSAPHYYTAGHHLFSSFSNGLFVVSTHVLLVYTPCGAFKDQQSMVQSALNNYLLN